MESSQGQASDNSPALNTADPSAYDLMMRRRSVVAKFMVEPGPDDTAIEKILAAGMRVPDHGKLEPWRFIVLDKAAQGDVDALIAAALEAEGDDDAAKKATGYASQAPLAIIVVSSFSDARPIPEWEQTLSAGAVCQSMLLAATSLGYASQWLTGWPSYSPMVAKGLGLGNKERIAGILFFGSQKSVPSERPRPKAEAKIQYGING